MSGYGGKRRGTGREWAPFFSSFFLCLVWGFESLGGEAVADDSSFHVMFSNIDNLKSTQLLYLSSKGLAACDEGGDAGVAETHGRKGLVVEGESEDEDGEPEDG